MKKETKRSFDISIDSMRRMFNVSLSETHAQDNVRRTIATNEGEEKGDLRQKHCAEVLSGLNV
ncbi:MAG: hypothetical protein GF401_17440 [Chitinivibrionales bacterium]|nr:hypothetical protein [Chitinivibrionales bacterium]